jgi:hypothetical protein
MIENFIAFYAQFDKRLLKINRNKINVKEVENGYYVSCTYYGKEYGQHYGNFSGV